MTIEMLPRKKPPNDHPPKSFERTKSRHRLSRREIEDIKDDFRYLYDKGVPIKQIGLMHHLSDKQIRKMFAELVTDRNNPLKLREDHYDLIELTEAFRRYFRMDYFPQDCKYVEAKLDNGQVILKPVYFK